MTKKEFLSFAQSKIIILDGANGSNLHKRGMPPGICPELWMTRNPEVLIDLQKAFLDAGTDILFSPTFTANKIKLAEYGLEDRIAEFNQEIIGLSKEALRRYRESSKDNRKIYIAGNLTMTGEFVYPSGRLTFEDLVEVYKEQLSYIISQEVDLIAVETMMSLQECRAALIAVKECCDLPVMITLTFGENDRTLFGTDPKTAVIVLQSMGVSAIGVNCSTGPDRMQQIVREMKEYARVPIIAKPNAGIPKLVDNKTVFPMDPEEFAVEMEKLVQLGADIVGGCCGSTPEHIKLMAERVKGYQPSDLQDIQIRALTTERRTVEIDIDGRFLVVGERINPTGKKALQQELKEGQLAIVSNMAIEQEKLGADFLDINMGMAGIDEMELMIKTIHEVMQITQTPFSIDSSNTSVIEAALRLYPGRALINSISLEKEKFEKLIPIAKKYGAMFILLPLSDQGLPKDIEEKKQIIHTILDRAYENGLSKEDIIVDGLVNTVGANPNAAIEAMETIRYCKQELGIATIVGLSNISFGLPERQFINSTFLSLAIQAGLTMAIANPSQDLFMNTALAADLLLGREDAAKRYIDRVTLRPTVISGAGADNSRNAGAASPQDNNLQSEEHQEISEKNGLYKAVLMGNKKNIISFVEQALEKKQIPEEIIEKTLIPAINEVGTLFDKQKYFLPQLIASAEAMKTAIDYLEPMLSISGKEQSKGTIVIATVAGDIHDIGKNLVALMLKNYGYRVIDLGKDVPSEKIIQTAEESGADIIALSALMTTTMVEMKRVISLAKERNLKAKIIIGGAVITQGYAQEIGANGYSKDAQSAVGLVKQLLT